MNKLRWLWYKLYHKPLYYWYRDITQNKRKALLHLYGPLGGYLYQGPPLDLVKHNMVTFGETLYGDRKKEDKE